MTELLWSKLIDLLGVIFGALATLVGVIVVVRQSNMHKQMNSRMDQLVVLEKRLSELEGNKAGIKEGKEEMKAQQAAVAVALATPVAVPVVVPHVVVPVVGQTDVLKKIENIEENTAKIADNTKPKTDE